jgi:hypothetical protein
MADRRSDYDVTNTVRVSSTADVRDAVQQLFRQVFPDVAFDALWIAFHDFDRLFSGTYRDYIGCDTVYHDRQHSLDITLAMARLLAGYELSSDAEDRLGADRAVLGIIAALFHDAGYIRRQDEVRWQNGAQFTRWHVSRSADFLRDYLPTLQLGDMGALATQLVHFTGYELDLDEIELNEPRDTLVGHLLGTADLIAQMADRCYLEKCRDRLYAEFVISGVAFGEVMQAQSVVTYSSGIDLLRQTPDFWSQAISERMNRKFNRVYRYVEALFDGRNPYLEFINSNLGYLSEVMQHGEWDALRRKPPVYTVVPDVMERVGALVSRQLAEHAAPAS